MRSNNNHTPQAHIFSDSKSETELSEYLGVADVLDPRWGLGRFHGVFDELTKKPSSGQCVFEEAIYTGEFDDNADFSGQGILMFKDGGGFASGTFKNGKFQHGILHFVESKMTAIIRKYLDDGSWIGTVFYDEDGGWADGVFGEDWTLLEGDEFDSEGDVVRSVERESDADDE